MTKIYGKMLLASGLAFATCAMAATGGFRLVKSGDPQTPEAKETVAKHRFPSMASWGSAFKAQEKMLSQSRQTEAADEEKEVLIDQNFSLMTAGSETELGTYITEGYEVGDPFISAEYTGEEGWWGAGVYTAGGMAALAHPNFGGVICSPSRELYGRLTVSLKVKVREGNPEARALPFFVNCVKGDFDYPYPVNGILYETGAAQNIYRQTLEDGWVEITAVIYNPYKGNDCWIQINAANYSAAGILINDLKVSRDYDFCMQPTNLLSYDFTNEGFTAYWQPGAENKSYLLTLMEKKATGEEAVEAVETFDGISVNADGTVVPATLPSGFDINLGEGGLQGVTDGGAKGTPAIVLDDSEDFIRTLDNGGALTSLSFYGAPHLVEGSYAVVGLRGFDGFEWMDLGELGLSKMAGGACLDVAESLDITRYQSVEIYVDDLHEDEYLVIDQIQWSTEEPMKVSMLKEDEPVSDNNVVLEGLDPEATYFFAVKGVNGELVSPQTDFKIALGCPAPKVLEAVDIEKRGAYTARWEPSVKAESYLVSNYETRKVQADEAAYKVLSDTFAEAKADGDIYDHPNANFDGISDVKGWIVDNGVYADGAIGASGYGTLFSPELTLSNGDGKFTVVMTAAVYEECSLVVQYGGKFEQLTFDGDPDEETGLIKGEFALTFDNGDAHDRILFYSPEEDLFLIYNIEVLQDVKKGDLIHTLVGTAEVDGHDSDSHRFTGLTNSPDFTYTYNVTAYSHYMGETFHSNHSEDINVDLNANVGIEEIAPEEKSATVITSGKGVIEVSLPEASVIRVYDSLGNLLEEVAGTDGENVIEMKTGGVYVIVTASATRKVVVY